MDINDIFRPHHTDLLRDINTQLVGVTVHYDTVTLSRGSLSLGALKLNKSLPTLYYFEIKSRAGYSNFDLVDIFTKYRAKNKATYVITAVNHPMPATLNKSECLYVGKVRSEINTRLSIHLGLSKDKSTGGLRLNKWLPTGVELVLHIYQLEGMIDAFLVDPFEEYLRKIHNPILGVK